MLAPLGRRGERNQVAWVDRRVKVAAGDTRTREPGVYFTDKNGVEHLVCWYQGGEYDLGDILDFFQLGELEETRSEDETALVLTRRELGTLKTMADSYSFDYEPEFIEMCLEIVRFADARDGERFRFAANF